MELKSVPILIAEGAPATIGLIRRSLRGMDFQNVEAASDGFDTITKLKNRATGLLLLDWSLPRMDAREILQYMSRIPHYKAPRIIVMVKAEDKNAIAANIPKNINEILVKPFTGVILKQKIEKVMGQTVL